MAEVFESFYTNRIIIVIAVMINIYAAWIGFLLGCVAGAIPGLFFYGEDWLGGYASWPRRMIRLGHIAFFGIGFLNLAFGLTSRMLGMNSGLTMPSSLFIVGAVTMPVVCYMSAWKSCFRHIFFVPALSVIAAIVLFLWRMLSI
jgi:hypothetical protein